MRKQIFCIMIIALLIYATGSKAEIVMDKKVQSKIAKILQQPVQVYRVDSDAGMRILIKIDDWVNNRIDLSRANKNKFKKEDHEGFLVKMEKNAPISASGKNIQGVQPKQAFDVFYIQNSYKRRFVKDVTVPTRKKLSKETVERIGRDFIKHREFCRQTEFDRIGRADVVSRVRQQIKEAGALGEKLILSQDVVFKRYFKGLEVFNSKQTVGIHPESKEILAYKTFNWTPVNEQSGKKMTYEKLDVILKRIENAFEKSPYTFEVTDVSSGMYQAEDMIFPVIRIKAEPQLKEGEPEPGRKILIVGLVKGLEVGAEKKRSGRRPQSPKEKKK